MPDTLQSLRNKARHGYHIIRGEEVRVRALGGLIGLLFAVALGTAIETSWNGKPHPEIIVETCSFLGALLVVAVQRGAAKRALRRRALKNVLSELIANAAELASGELMRTGAELTTAVEDHGDGLRYYYSHLATTATRSAILSGAFDGRRDDELLTHLSRWVHDCEACNRRFMMSELRLFSATPDVVGVQERVRIHVSIVTGPAVHQRRELRDVAIFLRKLDGEQALPKQLTPLLAKLSDALERFPSADAIGAELQEDFGVTANPA
jgi:hypothetical protein